MPKGRELDSVTAAACGFTPQAWPRTVILAFVLMGALPGLLAELVQPWVLAMLAGPAQLQSLPTPAVPFIAAWLGTALCGCLVILEIARRQWRAEQRQQRAGGKPASKAVQAREEYQQQRLTLGTTTASAWVGWAAEQICGHTVQLLSAAGLHVPELLQ